jgi:Mg2+ and Co2+ transporter CorA
MNFRALWFTNHPFGVWYVFGFMLALAVSMFAFFRAKGWI